MKKGEFDLLMHEIRDVRDEIKEVRQIDIPTVLTRMAVMEANMLEFKAKVNTRSTLVSSVGGLIAVATSFIVSHFK